MTGDRGIGCAAKHQKGNQGSIPYFDSVAGEYFAKYAEDSPGGYGFRVRKARVLELLADARGRVLDVGCGPGVMVQDILKRGCEFWGVDASPKMIAECRTRFGHFPQTHFSVGNAMALPFPDGTFDFVICMGVIDRVVQPEVAILEMGRVLRPGGALLISFPNLLSPYALWRHHLFYPIVGWLKQVASVIGSRRRQPDPCPPGTLWTPRTSSRTVERLVGKISQIAYYNFSLLLSPLEELFPAMAVHLTNRLERLRGNRFRWLGAGFIIKAVKVC